MNPGSREWLKARIQEHKTSQEQSLAQANAHAGAVQAYERLLNELPIEAVETEQPEADDGQAHAS